MYMRAITIRIAYVAVLSAGIVLAAAFRQSAVQAAPAPLAAAQPVATSVAPLPIVTLPAVHVRSAAAAPRAPLAKSPALAPLVAAHGAEGAEAHGGGSLPSLRLDMPYYSFGKLLPRVGKE